MDNQTPNPHELLDQVNRFEQLTQAEEARDLFAEMSQLLEHDGQEPDGRLRHVCLRVLRRHQRTGPPEPGRLHPSHIRLLPPAIPQHHPNAGGNRERSARCALFIVPEELRPIMNDLAGQNPALAIP